MVSNREVTQSSCALDDHFENRLQKTMSGTPQERYKIILDCKKQNNSPKQEEFELSLELGKGCKGLIEQYDEA